MSEQLNQYERQRALDDIDGYFTSPPHRTESNISIAFEMARAEFISQLEKRIANVNTITLEQFLKWKGPTAPKSY